MGTRKNPNKLKGDVRAAVLKSALKLYGREGFAGTRTLDVAKDAGVSHSHLRYYFPDLDALTKGVMEEVLESLKLKTLEFIDRSPHARNRLLDYVAAPFEWGAEHPRWMSIWLYLYYQASFSPAIKAQNTEIRRGGRRRIEELLRHGIATGEFGISAKDAPRIALQIHLVATGGLSMAFNETGLDADSVKTICQELCLALAKG